VILCFLHVLISLLSSLFIVVRSCEKRLVGRFRFWAIVIRAHISGPCPKMQLKRTIVHEYELTTDINEQLFSEIFSKENVLLLMLRTENGLLYKHKCFKPQETLILGITLSITILYLKSN
jgi:hypothetical protein